MEKRIKRISVEYKDYQLIQTVWGKGDDEISLNLINPEGRSVLHAGHASKYNTKEELEELIIEDVNVLLPSLYQNINKILEDDKDEEDL